jgi:hypothetical protein
MSVEKRVQAYSAYATAFRYPTPGGRIPADPPAEELSP